LEGPGATLLDGNQTEVAASVNHALDQQVLAIEAIQDQLLADGEGTRAWPEIISTTTGPHVLGQ
jgi:hypothetical protein